MEVDKEEEEDMPATARDLGLGFKWLYWEPKPRWSEECSPWHMSPRCFLNSCSSLVACVGTKEAVEHQKTLQPFQDPRMASAELFTSSSER